MIEEERLCTTCGHPFLAQKTGITGQKKWYYCDDCRVEMNKKHTAGYHKRKRLEALIKISDPIRCSICGVTDLQVLQIDHINDDGPEDRKRYGSGIKLYLYIVRTPKEEIQEKYQLLCANCNMKKRYS